MVGGVNCGFALTFFDLGGTGGGGGGSFSIAFVSLAGLAGGLGGVCAWVNRV